MGEKSGKPYENLTQVIFQAIVNQNQIPNVVVEQNVTLQGKTASHQIDVYWKFEFAGVTHEAIVQAKNWNKPVDQLHLLAFKEILDDLPGQPRGIFVMRSGYQEGAKEFALAHGILIYELKEFEDQPALAITAGGWAHLRLVRMPLHGVVTTGEPSLNPSNAIALGFDYDVFTPRFSEITFNVSSAWLKEQYPNADTSAIRRLNVASPELAKIVLFDENDAEVSNLATVFGGLVEKMKKEGVDKKRAVHIFDPPVFFRTVSTVIPRVKTIGVSVSVEIEQRHDLRRAKMSNFAQLVLHELNSDKRWWFAASPQVISTLSKKRKPRLK